MQVKPPLDAAAGTAVDDPSTKPNLEHLAVFCRDVGQSCKFLQKALGWRLHPMVFGVAEDNPVFGGMDLRFVDANGLWLEMVQPTTPGPGMELLKEKGNGAITELDFLVGDFDRTMAHLRARGINAIGMDGKPMVGDAILEEYVIMADGTREKAIERLSYLPFDAAYGTCIEMLWEYPNGAVIVRDKQWNATLATPKDMPRLDHVVVLAEDLEASAKVYADVLRLPRHAMSTGLHREWMGYGEGKHAWFEANPQGFPIELVEPDKNVTGGAARAKFGDGNIMELVVEVPDMDAFYDRMQAQGITLMAGDTSPLPPGNKSVTVMASGDRYAYLPLDASEGIRILLFQTGAKGQSMCTLRSPK